MGVCFLFFTQKVFLLVFLQKPHKSVPSNKQTHANGTFSGPTHLTFPPAAHLWHRSMPQVVEEDATPSMARSSASPALRRAFDERSMTQGVRGGSGCGGSGSLSVAVVVKTVLGFHFWG